MDLQCVSQHPFLAFLEIFTFICILVFVIDNCTISGSIKCFRRLMIALGLVERRQHTILAFTGLRGCGKTYFARYLEELGAIRLSFAAPIKEIALALTFPGKNVYGTTLDKELDVPHIGTSFRNFAQIFGTEIARKLFPKYFPQMNLHNKTLWVKIMEYKLRKIMQGQAGSLIVIDDLRFIDEADLVVSEPFRGYIIRLISADNKAGCSQNKFSQHISEAGQQHIMPDVECINDRTTHCTEKIKKMLYAINYATYFPPDL